MTDTAKRRQYELEGQHDANGPPTLVISYDPDHHQPHTLAAQMAKQMGVKLKKGAKSKAL